MGCTDSGAEKEEVSTVDNSAETEIDKDVTQEVAEVDESEDDDTVIIGGEEWPTEFMDDIPQVAGKITSVSIVTSLRHIKMESVKRKDAESFVESLKSLGFTLEPGETNSKTTIVYNSKHEDERSITFGWSKDKGEVDIIYMLP